MFPLQLVLFPNATLPLHIFEERYKEMIGRAIAAQAEFGVVQAGERGIVNTGCTAVVERVLRRDADGQLDILVVGRRRFEILVLNDEEPFLRGAVDYFDDDEFGPVPPETLRLAIERYQELREIKGDEIAEPDLTASQLSFRLAQPIPDLDFRQLLLATRSEAERMKQVAEFLSGYVSKERAIAHMRETAPRNGHGKWPGGIEK